VGQVQKLLNGGAKRFKPPARLFPLWRYVPRPAWARRGPNPTGLSPSRGTGWIVLTSMDRVDNAKAALPTLAHRLPTPPEYPSRVALVALRPGALACLNNVGNTPGIQNVSHFPTTHDLSAVNCPQQLSK